MEKKLVLFDKKDRGDHEQLLYDYDSKELLFGVKSLTDMPEFAIIGKGIPGHLDAINLIATGMRYVSKGYNDIDYICIDCPSEEEIRDFAEKYLYAK